MPEDQQAKDELRLKQAVRIIEATIAQFGVPMTLDAVALTLRTPDGMLLACAADFSRKILELETKAGPTLPPDPMLFQA